MSNAGSKKRFLNIKTLSLIVFGILFSGGLVYIIMTNQTLASFNRGIHQRKINGQNTQLIFVSNLLIFFTFFLFFLVVTIEIGPTILRRNYKWLKENKLSFFVYSAIIIGFILFSIDYFSKNLLNIDFWNNVLVEAHGMYLDILLFGIIFTLYERFYEKNNDIKRYQEEIDDYRRWNEDEAKFRVVGNLKRLLKYDAKNIDISECYLKEANLAQLNLSSINFLNSYLEGAMLNETVLKGTKCIGTNFSNACFGNTDFSNADLSKAKFHYCFLTDIIINKETKLNGMTFHSSHEINITERQRFNDIPNNIEFINMVYQIFGGEYIIINAGSKGFYRIELNENSTASS